MNLAIDFFITPGTQKQNIRIWKLMNLTGKEASFIREEIKDLLNTKFETIYIDARNVQQVDLSGINEIIHSNFTLKQSNKKLVLIYRKQSTVEKWVNTTRLDSFMDTALLPAN